MVVTQRAIFDDSVKQVTFSNLRQDKTFKRNQILLIIGGIFFIAFGTLIWTGVILSGVSKAFAVAAWILGVMFFVVLAGAYIFMKININKTAKTAAQMNLEYTLGDQGLDVKSTGKQNHYDWSQFQIRDHQDNIELYVPEKKGSIFFVKSELKNKEVSWILSKIQ